MTEARRAFQNILIHGTVKGSIYDRDIAMDEMVRNMSLSEKVRVFLNRTTAKTGRKK